MKKILVILLFLLVLFNYAYNIEPNRLIIKELSPELNNWSENLKEIKILIVSDLHIGTNKVSLNRLKEIVEKINVQNPDIVFLLGDFDATSIYYSKISQNEISGTLAQIKSTYGNFAVLGNHDYKPENIVKQILNNSKIVLLEDSSKVLKINGESLRICGVRDWWHYDVDVKSVLGNIDKPTIFLSHNPDAFAEVPQSVALTLSGHTHGGEIALPIWGGLHIPSAYGRQYAKGLIKDGEKTLFVTSGIASLSRFRTFNPPEIVVLKL